MAGINSGVFKDALPLSQTQINELERKVLLEQNAAYAYLNDKNEISFMQKFSPDGLKGLAWSNDYELTSDENGFKKRVYVRTGLETWNHVSTYRKTSIDETWQQEGDVPTDALPAGLYQTGAIALYEEQGAEAVEGMMITSWDELVSSGAILIEDDLSLNTDYTVSPSILCGDLVLSENITSINDWAFEDCSNLTNIMIPDSVTRVGMNTFYGCTSLAYKEYDNAYYLGNNTNTHAVLMKSTDTSIASCILNDSTRVIAARAFDRNSSLTSIVIPDSVTGIGESAFYECSSLASVTIGNGVTNIGGTAFYSCIGLTSIEIPDSVTSIGSSAFSKCAALASVTIGNSVTSIGRNAFSDCSNLKSVYITDIAKWCEIDFVEGQNANPLYFAKNLYLNGTLVTNLEIPEGVSRVGEYAFCNCTSFTSVTIPDSVTSIELWAFYCCTGLVTLTIPGSVKTIGNLAFYKCSNLTEINILEGVTSIPYAAFQYCSVLNSITIPSSVIEIGKEALRNCSKLTDIYYNGTMEQWSAITKGSNWNKFTGNYIIHCTDGNKNK